MITELARYSASVVLMTNGVVQRSTEVTWFCTIVAPNRSACARISVIRSGPRMPSRCPGQFSTSVVSISCPPASSPSMTSGCRLARAVYRAAVSPAGPDPMMITLCKGDWGGIDEFQDIRILGFQDCGRFQDFRIAGLQDFRIAKFQNGQILTSLTAAIAKSLS